MCGALKICYFLFIYLLSNSLCGSLSQNMKIFDAIEHVNLYCNQINVSRLDQLDLSNNNLSDVILKFLEALPSYLKYLNLSFNKAIRLSYSKEPPLSLLCTHIMLMGRPYIFLLLAFLLMQSCVLQFSQSSNNFTDQSALISFKSQITFSPNDSVFAGGNWSTTTNFCEWFGVSCSRRRQRVTALNLSYVGLQGTISPHIANLSFLVSLDLKNNSFSGFLPHEISHLHRLRKLLLSNNLLEGSVPPTIHNCQKLEYFYLGYNNFSGGIPKELGMLPKLRGLYLAGNSLSGTIPLSLSNMSSLEILSLSVNSLTGPFPLVIFNLSSLTIIAITENHFSGTLPMNLCTQCPNLQGLYISRNEFSGKLTSQFNNCTELFELSLSYNKFDGSIPKGFGSLEKLEGLYLGGNNLTGNIPPIISNSSMLQKFTIERNNVKGGIPSDLWRLQNLNVLAFQLNDLTGTIPQNIFNITSLQYLGLAGNSLSGNLLLDTWISCPNLEILGLASNKISGHIPSYLSNISSLSLVDFSRNFLSGHIPRNLGNLKNLQWLGLSENQLTAEPGHQEHSFLLSLTNCRFLEKLYLSYNPLNITIPDAIGNFSLSLKVFDASESQINGQIPMGIGNSLTGNIPSIFRGLENLQRLFLDENLIEGSIPEQLCQLKNLGELSLSINSLSRSIPNCIGNLSVLQKFNLSYNALTSSIPLNMWSLQNLLFLDLSSNFLSGSPTSLGSRVKQVLLKYIVPAIASIIIFAALVIMRRRHPQCNMQIPGLRCSEESPDERPDIKDVVTKVNKIKLALHGNISRGV
ncbi:lrr receptor-like serine/threonine-protein kinase efr [Quercus suber]|uniref:Lrr receptor-like serine/threonine-protein kinase efr n=1 Tax=Quercus suber TaxID=58331 RepID=A0AAW0L8M2_QUESU